MDWTIIFAIRNHANSSKLYLKGKGDVSKATALNRLSERLGESINEAQLCSILRADMSNDPIVKNIVPGTKDLETELAEADDQHNAFEDEETSSASEAIACATTPIAQRREASSPIARRQFSATSPIWTPGARTVPNYTRTDPTDAIRRWEDIMAPSMEGKRGEAGGVGDSDEEYDFDGYFSSDSDDSDSEDSDDTISDDSNGDAHSDFTLDDDSDDGAQTFNRVVDNAEMRTIDGEPETT